MPLFSAALTACTSPRRANMPVSPTGASTMGIASFWLKRVVSRLRLSTFFRMRWRRLTSLKSALLALNVCSA
ncbi:hypothetical protein D3C80_2038170 [compost metagenome]